MAGGLGWFPFWCDVSVTVLCIFAVCRKLYGDVSFHRYTLVSLCLLKIMMLFHCYTHDTLAYMGTVALFYRYGEGFNYDHASADYWLTEISGLALGLPSDMLRYAGTAPLLRCRLTTEKCLFSRQV